jgi:hypothetical protein
MEELLKKLLEADILNEDTKVELEAAFQAQLADAVTVAEAEASERVRTDLTEQWITERDALIEAVDTKVEEYLTKEVEELKEDIERFRDLETEHAEKLVEAKGEMATELQSDMSVLVEKLNTFLEIRLTAELDELKEDLQEAKKLQFGKEIFEGFAREFDKSFGADEESVQSELAETKVQLDDAMTALRESEEVAAVAARDAKLAELLEPLTGRQRDVMEAILKNVQTEQLEEGYKTFIGRVLKEETEESQDEKETPVLAEGDDSDKPETVIEGTVVTGDTETVLEENADEAVVVDKSHLDQLRKLAGV